MAGLHCIGSFGTAPLSNGRLLAVRRQGRGLIFQRPERWSSGFGTNVQALARSIWIARRVKNSVDGYSRFQIFVEDSIRKASNEAATVLIADRGISLGIAPNVRDGRIDRRQKLFSEPDTPGLLPPVRVRHIKFGFGRDNQVSDHGARARAASLRPSLVLSRDSSGDYFSCGPIPRLASRGRALPPMLKRCRPRGPPRVEVFRKGSVRRLTLRADP